MSTWESPIASNNNKQFAYDYKSSTDTIKLTKLWYGANSEDVIEDGDIPLHGKIELNNSSAPVRFIQTRLKVVHTDGTEEYVYGKGCYCGATTQTQELFALSKQFKSEHP